MASREGLCLYPNRCTRAAGKHGRHRFQHVRPCRPLWQNPRSAIMNARFSSSKHAIVYYLASLLSFFSALNARSCCRAEGAPTPEQSPGNRQVHALRVTKDGNFPLWVIGTLEHRTAYDRRLSPAKIPACKRQNCAGRQPNNRPYPIRLRIDAFPWSPRTPSKRDTNL